MERTLCRFAMAGVLALLAAWPAAAQQAHVNLDWNPQKNTQNLVPFGANVISPEVGDDGMVTFRVNAPGAREILLVAPTISAASGILSAGDPESETSTPEFLNDPQINAKVDYLLVGLGTRENDPKNRSMVFHQILEKHGVRHDYYTGGNGGHDWATWRHVLYARLLPGLWRGTR